MGRKYMHQGMRTDEERRKDLERLLNEHEGVDDLLRRRVLRIFDEQILAGEDPTLVPDQLLEYAADSIFVHSLSGELLAVNAVACQRLGYEKEEILGKHVHFLSYDCDDEVYKQRRDRVLSRKSYTFETRQRHKDGRPVPLEVSARLVDYKGESVVLSIARDLTARKAAENIMLEQKQFLSAVLEHLPVGLLIKRVRSGYTIHLWNSSMEQLTGLSRTEALGRTDFDIFPEELAESFRATDLEAVDQETIVNVPQIEFRTQTNEFIGRTLTVPLKDANGQPEAVLVMVLDVTERVMAQQRLMAIHEELEQRVEERTSELQEAHDRLMEAEEHYRALYEQSSEAIFVIDKQGRILHGNPAARGIFGYGEEEIRALDPLTMIHPDDVQVAPEMLETVRSGEITHRELRMKRKDGGFVDVMMAAKRIAGDHVLATLWDITERKRMEEELRAAKVAAERANEAKSEFLANMSHEIRTPMGGILGMTDMVLSMDLKDEQREYLKGIKSASLSLLDIINDILDFSKIEANKLELAQEPFELRKRMEGLCDTFRLDAVRKGISLSYSIDRTLPRTLYGDAGRIGQVVSNLLSNALKFTDAGAVMLEVDMVAEQEQAISVRFAVTDTGIGIPEDQREKLFDVFSQLDPSMSKRQPGTGLGLAISRRLVEMMGGVIGVTSEPGRGSTFSFVLDLEPVRQAKGPESAPGAAGNSGAKGKPAAGGAGYDILLAEDNMLNQEFLTHFLVEAGHRVRVAENGLLVLQALEENAYDIVLMDIQMPEMDGIQATREIRKHDGSKYDPEIPVVALTAYAMKGDKERMLAAGLNDYLSKPVDMDSLLAVISKMVAGNSSD